MEIFKFLVKLCNQVIPGIILFFATLIFLLTQPQIKFRHFSYSRIKKVIKEVNPEEQLKNVNKIKIVQYKYRPEFINQLPEEEKHRNYILTSNSSKRQ